MSKLKEQCRVHTDLLKMDNRQGATVQCRELCSMSRGRLDGMGFGGGWIRVYMWLSPFTFHLNDHSIVNQLYPNTK